MKKNLRKGDVRVMELVCGVTVLLRNFTVYYPVICDLFYDKKCITIGKIITEKYNHGKLTIAFINRL